jgi:hypothetical protein
MLTLRILYVYSRFWELDHCLIDLILLGSTFTLS